MPPPPQWLLFAAGALSYGVACLWSSRSRERDHEALEKEDEQRKDRRRRRRRRRAEAARAAVAAAAAAAAVVTTTVDQQQQQENDDHQTYRPLRERVSACQARWVLEELAAATATAEEEQDDGGERDNQVTAGRHAARAVEMLAAGYGSGLGVEDAARWARVAWALQTGRRPAEADLAAVAVGGGGVARRRGRRAGNKTDDDDRTDDALAESDHTEPPSSLSAATPSYKALC